MTEQEWLACTQPLPMLEFLKGEASPRKLRLFACACCRRIWHLIGDHRSRDGVEVSEKYADGMVTAEQFLAAHAEVEEALNPGAWAAGYAMSPAFDIAGYWEDFDPANYTAPYTIYAACCCAKETATDAGEGEQVAQAALVRDIFGNPFRPVTVDPSWRSSNVVSLAQAIYDERAFDRLPILADALEDAGCTNADVLTHCRQPGEHVRGCWVIDLLLGKS